jgi:hypothetical protein
MDDHPKPVDAQREELASQLAELEATERVLARYSKGPRARKMALARTPIAATKAAAPARSGGRPRTTAAKPAGGKRSSPSLNDQVLALASGKTQREIAAACLSGSAGDLFHPGVRPRCVDPSPSFVLRGVSRRALQCGQPACAGKWRWRHG